MSRQARIPWKEVVTMNAGSLNRKSSFNRMRISIAIIFALTCLLAPVQSSRGQDDGLKKPQRPEGSALTPIALRCARYTGQASPEEIAATPRQFPDLERLAIKMGGTFTPNPVIYARVVSDVTGIRSSNPQLHYPYKGEETG